MTKNLEIAELFEKIIEKIPPSIALPWITVEWLGVLNYNKKTMDEVKVSPEHIIELLDLIKENKITPLKAKDILRKFIPESFSPNKVAKESVSITDIKDIEKIIDEILKKNEKSVKDYKAGESKALNFLIGQVMQATNKRADFMTIKKILEKKLR